MSGDHLLEPFRAVWVQAWLGMPVVVSVGLLVALEAVAAVALFAYLDQLRGG